MGGKGGGLFDPDIARAFGEEDQPDMGGARGQGGVDVGQARKAADLDERAFMPAP
jgi:hypothetical protein